MRRGPRLSAVSSRTPAAPAEDATSKSASGDTLSCTRTVDIHVAWLRQKLEENPKFPQWIQTVRGLGYKFTA